MHGLFRKIAIILAVSAASVAVVLLIIKSIDLHEPYVDMSSTMNSNTSSKTTDAINTTLRFAVATMVSAENTFSTYQDLVHKIGGDIGRNEIFVIRPTYREVRLDIEKGTVDVAFVCTGTYTHSSVHKYVELLVQPEFIKDYRCLVIVPADSPANSLEDLQGKEMTFTDRESHTGYIVPMVAISDKGYNPATFFSKVVFSGSHDRSIHAVEAGIVDAACINSLVWESLLRQNPMLETRVKIVYKSDTYGPPAILVPTGLDEDMKKSLRQAFLSVHESEEGRRILEDLMIQRFVPGREEDYRSALETNEKFDNLGDIR